MLYSPGIGEIPVSVSSIQSGRLYHTIRSVGLVSEALTQMEPGASLGVRGPFGSHWPLDDSAGRNLLFIAGGLGLAPLRPAIEYALAHRDDFGSVHVLYGARDPEHMIFREAWAQWEIAGARLGFTVDNAGIGWTAAVGTLPLLLESLTLPVKASVAFVCGPEIMMRLTADKLLGQGMDAKDIHLSLERNMKCALGFCGHCQFGPAFLCRNGPILSYDRIASLMKVKQL